MRRNLAIAAFVLPALALTTLLACEKSPPEPATKTSETLTAATSSAPMATTQTPDAKCIRKTPDEAPPPPVNSPAKGCPRDPTGPPMLARLDIPFSSGPHIQAELARTPAENERGLMYRMRMDEDAGMIFRMGDRKNQVFWMHNTCISLDMLFVDDDGTIVGIVENAPTLDDGERQVGCPSSYVLETNAGWSRRHGVKAGQTLTIPDAAR